MALLRKKRNGSIFPAPVEDFFMNDRFFTPAFVDLNNELAELNGSLMVPDLNIIENDKEYSIELAAPGLERKDFKVEVQDDVLTISAEKKEEVEKKKKNYWRKEFSYNSFCRSLAMPKNARADKMDAKYENGILRITLPKKEAALSAPRHEVKVS
jgi:HSP20 family protein